MTNEQFSLASSVKQKKKLKSLFTYLLNIERWNCMIYSGIVQKTNNHTYLKLTQLNQEKKARFPTDEIRYTTVHMKKYSL